MGWQGQCLLCAKGPHGLDSGGSTGGKRCCYQDHNDDEGRGRRKSHGVVYDDAVKLAAEVSGEEGDGGQREEGGNSGDKNHLAQDSYSTCETEDAAFNEQLRDDTGAAGPEGVAHGHLSGASGRAKEQECCHVDGAHGDKQAGHAHQEDERGFEIQTAGREASRVVFHAEMRVIDEILAESFGAIFEKGKFLSAKGAPEWRETGFGLRDGYAGLYSPLALPC